MFDIKYSGLQQHLLEQISFDIEKIRLKMYSFRRASSQNGTDRIKGAYFSFFNINVLKVK